MHWSKKYILSHRHTNACNHTMVPAVIQVWIYYHLLQCQYITGGWFIIALELIIKWYLGGGVNYPRCYWPPIQSNWWGTQRLCQHIRKYIITIIIILLFFVFHIQYYGICPPNPGPISLQGPDVRYRTQHQKANNSNPYFNIRAINARPRGLWPIEPVSRTIGLSMWDPEIDIGTSNV